MRDEPVASYLQEALEGFASGRFETQAKVKCFLESCPDFPKDTKTGSICIGLRLSELGREIITISGSDYLRL